MQSYVDEKIEACNVGTWVPSGLHSGTGMLPLELLPLEIKTNGLGGEGGVYLILFIIHISDLIKASRRFYFLFHLIFVTMSQPTLAGRTEYHADST